MSDKTEIEWTDATWNPVTGCTKVSPGCKHCYAEREWPRMTKLVPSYAGRDFTEVMTHGDRLDKPLRWRRPRRIFVNSMSDLFHPSVPEEFIDRLFAVVSIADHHTFQILTKRADRMRQYMNTIDRLDRVRAAALRLHGDVDDISAVPVWPPTNAHLGVSVEDQAAADERIPMLLQTPAAVRWISAEPLLGQVELRWGWVSRGRPIGGGPSVNMLRPWDEPVDDPAIDWVVAGGESGPKARPMHPEWARRLRDQCAAAGVPFLFKQWGEWVPRSGALTGGETNFVELDPGCNRWPRVTRLGEHGLDTRISEHCTPDAGQDIYMQRVGKKLAGRLLDGVQHNDYPGVRQ